MKVFINLLCCLASIAYAQTTHDQAPAADEQADATAAQTSPDQISNANKPPPLAPPKRCKPARKSRIGRLWALPRNSGHQRKGSMNARAICILAHTQIRAGGTKKDLDKRWRLREFRVADLDGNQLRVFNDFSWELRQEQA